MDYKNNNKLKSKKITKPNSSRGFQEVVRDPRSAEEKGRDEAEQFFEK